MPSLVDVSGLTLNPEEASQISQAVIEEEFVNGPIASMHDVQTGIHHQMQIPFVGQMSDAGKKATGCTPNAASGIVLSEKFWDPQLIDARWEHCAADMAGLLKLFQKASRINPDFYDRIGSQELGLITALIGQMLRHRIPNLAWFSDSVAGNVTADGGDITDGVDKDLFNIFDGLWKQIFAAIPPGASNHVDIAANDGASFSDVKNLPVDFAFGMLEDMAEQADGRLLEDPSAYFAISRTLANNYRSTLRNKTLGAGFVEETLNGRPQLFFDGIPVNIMYEWDRKIEEIFRGGSTYTQPFHRAVLSTPDNLPLGTTSESDFDTLESFYDQYRKSNIIDFAMKLDAKLLESYKIVTAY